MDVCKQCGKDVETNTTFCTNCGHRLPLPKRMGVLPIVFIGFAFAVMLVAAITTTKESMPTTSRPTTNAAAPAQAPTGYGATPEGIYLGAAGSYLKGVNETATDLAQTMTGANDGSSTLEDIREAFKKAKFVESMGYQGDYKDKFTDVPPRCRPLAAKIEETHRLFQSAANETLLYWDDQNVAHITSGQATLKRSVLVMNDAIKEANRVMSIAAKEQGKKPS